MNNNHNFDYLVGLAKQMYQEAEKNAAENPTTPTIQVVIVEPNKKPYKEYIPNNLKAFNEIVGGYIENIFIGDTAKGANIGLIVNEEGKILNLPYNKRIFGNSGYYDILVGTIIITAYNLQGDNISLTDQEADKYIKRFSTFEVYL
jgi:hypothetical protein